MRGIKQLFVAIAAMVCLCGAHSARAQTPCTPHWEYGPDQIAPGLSGIVRAITTWDPDGAGPLPALTVVGGGLSVPGLAGTTNIAAWNPATRQWRALGTGFNAEVDALIVYHNTLIAGGAFYNGAGGTINGIARWDPAAAGGAGAWMQMGTYTSATVRSLTIYNDNLIAAGSFGVTVGSVSEQVVSWDGATGGVMATPHILGSAMSGSGTLYAVAVYNGSLYLGGTFAGMGATTIHSIAKWSGTAWTTLGTGGSGSTTGQGINGYVYTMAVYNNELVAAGFMQNAGTVAVSGIARWNGSTWSALGTGTGGLSISVQTLAVYQSELIVGGLFSTAGGVTASRIARWNGSAWSSLGATGAGGAAADNAVYALLADGPDLLVGGQFGTIGVGTNVAGSRLARWTSASASTPGVWSSFGNGLDGDVLAAAPYHGKLAVGGRIAHAGFPAAAGVAIWNGPSVGGWQTLGSGVYPLVVTSTVYNNEWVAAGNLSTAGGVSVDRIARYNDATGLWRGTGTNIVGDVKTVANIGGSLIAGGTFGIANFDDASTTWAAYPDIYFSGGVYALTQYNGQLVAGGDFGDSFSGSYGRIARWDAAAQSWMSLGGATIDSTVTALAVYRGELIAAGPFVSINGGTIPASHIAAFNGTTWRTLGEGSGGVSGGTLTTVNALAVYAGDLYVGGKFTTAGGGGTATPASNLAKWNGTAWSAVGGTGITGDSIAQVNSLTLFNNELIIGGRFLSAGGVPSPYFARWNACLCRADFNSTDGLTVQDIFDFLNAWLAADPRADFNGADGLTVQDIFDFLNGWLAGC